MLALFSLSYFSMSFHQLVVCNYNQPYI